MNYIGFDIGGSNIKVALLHGRKPIDFKIFKSPKQLGGLVNLISQTIENYEKEVGRRGIKGVGFAIAGVLDKKRERVLISPNVKYLNNQPIKKFLKKKIKYPIILEHDVHCFLLAEAKIGKAKNLKDVFYLTLGTGAGGALMVDGKIIIGEHGAAGEMGHIIVSLNFKNRNGFLEWEDLVSNKFIFNSLGINAHDAFKAAQKGDRKTKEVFQNLGKNLGIGAANIINIFNPEAVILSGGIIGARKFFVNQTKKNISNFVISPKAKKTKILFSGLGRYGGAIGAALMFEKRNRK